MTKYEELVRAIYLEKRIEKLKYDFSRYERVSLTILRDLMLGRKFELLKPIIKKTYVPFEYETIHGNTYYYGGYYEDEKDRTKSGQLSYINGKFHYNNNEIGNLEIMHLINLIVREGFINGSNVNGFPTENGAVKLYYYHCNYSSDKTLADQCLYLELPKNFSIPENVESELSNFNSFYDFILDSAIGLFNENDQAFDNIDNADLLNPFFYKDLITEMNEKINNKATQKTLN